MLEPKIIEEFAEQVRSKLPSGVKQLAGDFEDKSKLVLQQFLSKLDLVTREEFEVQQQILLKTRLQVEELEKKIMELEKN